MTRVLKIHFTRCLGIAALVLTALTIGGTGTQAVEPGEGNPGVFRVLMETDTLRILEASTEPGQAEGWHSHPRDFAYVVQGGTLRMESPDGTSREVTIAPGRSVELDPVVRHQGVNIGDTPIRILLVEFKTITD